MAPEAVPAPASRALRIGYAVAQSVTLLVFVGLCVIARRFEEIFNELEMSVLPAPTELCVAVGRLVRSPAGLALVGAAGVTLAVLGLRGRFDARLRKLIIGNVLAVVGLMAFYSLGLYMPIVQIRHALKSESRNDPKSPTVRYNIHV